MYILNNKLYTDIIRTITTIPCYDVHISLFKINLLSMHRRINIPCMHIDKNKNKPTYIFKHNK